MSARDDLITVLSAADNGDVTYADLADAVLAWLGTALADEALREAVGAAWYGVDPLHAAHLVDLGAKHNAARVLAVIRERLGVES